MNKRLLLMAVACVPHMDPLQGSGRLETCNPQLEAAKLVCDKHTVSDYPIPGRTRTYEPGWKEICSPVDDAWNAVSLAVKQQQSEASARPDAVPQAAQQQEAAARARQDAQDRESVATFLKGK